MDVVQAYPLPARSELCRNYIGLNLHNAPAPSVILDVAKVRKNCKLMLDAVQELGLGFRAHVKTHKTSELTRMSVGDNCRDVRLICSTLAELENLVPLLDDYRRQGAKVNVLYGIPPGTSNITRLAKYLQTMGNGSLSLMIDSPAQLETAKQVYEQSGKMTIAVFLKTDSGYHRAGLTPTSARMQELVSAALALETQAIIHVLGFYSHNSLSYGGNSPHEAMDNLRAEVDACTEAALANAPSDYISSRQTPLQISCGASPTALSLQNLLSRSSNTAATESADALRASLTKAKKANIHFEIHAGVYPTFDMQQVAATSRELGVHPEDNIAISVLTEVCSTYPDRTEFPEALVNAGCIALAREPCKAYRGHGVVTPWNMTSSYDAYTLENRIIVDRVAQEHGLLQWENKKRRDELPVQYGQKLRLWPNHACITSSQFGWYLVVDSEHGDKDVVSDVWVRWRGW